MQTGKSVCVTCREVNKLCEHEKIYCGVRWTAPRKANDKAWKLIASGDIWWDKRRISRPLRQGSEVLVTMKQHIRRKGLEKKWRIERRNRWLELGWGNPNSRTNRRWGTKL